MPSRTVDDPTVTVSNSARYYFGIVGAGRRARASPTRSLGPTQARRMTRRTIHDSELRRSGSRLVTAIVILSRPAIGVATMGLSQIPLILQQHCQEWIAPSRLPPRWTAVSVIVPPDLPDWRRPGLGQRQSVNILYAQVPAESLNKAVANNQTP